VEEGAVLRVRSVAAAVALPAREGGEASEQRVTAEVAGHLDLAPEPTVVAAGAHHRAVLTAALTGAGTLTAAERVLLGRTGERPGRWTGTTRVERDGVPLLHTTLDLGPGAGAWSPPAAPRAYASTVHAGAAAEVSTGQDAVRLPLPGGWLASAWGDELHRVAAACAALDPAAGERVPA
jgi:urease accessory protein